MEKETVGQTKETQPNRFDYVAYDSIAQGSQAGFKKMFMELETHVGTFSPAAGRAKALALTALEEAYMWIGKAIRDEQISRGSASLQEGRSNG